jgi:hypothetical protein
LNSDKEFLVASWECLFSEKIESSGYLLEYSRFETCLLSFLSVHTLRKAEKGESFPVQPIRAKSAENQAFVLQRKICTTAKIERGIAEIRRTSQRQQN